MAACWWISAIIISILARCLLIENPNQGTTPTGTMALDAIFARGGGSAPLWGAG
jgi:hypothetical protein